MENQRKDQAKCKGKKEKTLREYGGLYIELVAMQGLEPRTLRI